MNELTDVWTLETPDEEQASELLNIIIEQAINDRRVSCRNYLKKLWPECTWQTIKSRLIVEGSAWYVFYMDGVRQHMLNTA